MMQTVTPHRSFAAVLAIFGLCLMAAGCSETSPQSSGDDGWTLERDASEADAGPGDTSVDCGTREASSCRSHEQCTWYNPCSEDPSDGSCYREGQTPGPANCVPDDDCSTIPSKNRCREASLCDWASRSCADGSTTGRCVAPGAAPPTLECPASCSELETAKACRSQEDCGWTSKTCPDGTTVGACGGPLDGRPKLECPKEEPSCADRAPDRCEDGDCKTYEPGCGGDNPPQFDGPTCLAKADCEDDADCGEGLTCMTLALDPECQACGACAVGKKKCVPQAWAGAPGETGCRQYDKETCRQANGCGLVWPSSCNDEAPEGAETFEEPTCLPVQQCGDGQSCSEGYSCERLWTGCPPNAFCANCGSEEQRCLRESP